MMVAGLNEIEHLQLQCNHLPKVGNESMAGVQGMHQTNVNSEKNTLFRMLTNDFFFVLEIMSGVQCDAGRIAI
jgi:hypothetical protein